MDGDHRDKLYREGKLTDTQYRRAGGVCADEIDDKEYQDADVPGGGTTTDFGPDDAGHIDAAANRRGGDRESRARGRMPGARAPTIAEVEGRVEGASNSTEQFPRTSAAQVQKLSLS